MTSLFINNIAILNPKGIIASQQKELIIFSLLIMLLAVVPALFMAFFFAWRYRAGGKGKYTPNVDKNKAVQSSWLLLLLVIISILGVTAWKSSHALDPRKELASDKPPITIQVVALEWKWLFIYPEQNIASVNYIEIPEDTPINFEITADAPMNSFWIPQLGGQMYAMNGMKTSLHLMANEIGEYKGQSSNISGEGFSGMRFIVKASSVKDFDDWLVSAKKSQKSLTTAEYNLLAKPSKNNSVDTYVSTDSNLFDSIIMKYMPASPVGGATPMPMEHMH